MNKMNIVKSNDLCFEYPNINADNPHTEEPALKKINISVNKGEFVAILGHNGSGKSTLAKHMNALLIPTGGTIIINGYDSKLEENIWQIRQSAGMVFQNPDNQIIATIVEEDVAFGPENLGVAPQEIRTRVDDALQSVGMQEYNMHAPHFLSGGQKQRIAIAGVLAMRPELIILDEPTAMLDPIGRSDVLGTVSGLNKEHGITIILITHFMDEAVRADRVIVMEEGSVVMEGCPREVFKEVERIKALKLDVPQVAELNFKLLQEGFSLPESVLSIDEMVNELCRLKFKT